MSDRKQLPKIMGGDIELGNSVVDNDDTPAAPPSKRAANGRYVAASYNSPAATILLKHIGGVDRGETGGQRYRGTGAAYGGGNMYSGDHGSWGYQDMGRKYLACNGGCAYIDMGHLEMCLPEVWSAYDHVAAWHALIRIARDARASANEELASKGETVEVNINNSDGQGNSYGSHMNFLISREAFRDLFELKLHYMLFLSSFFASSIVYTGGGKVGSENGMPRCDFQLAQRVDFMECLTGQQTTSNRPIVNTRNEALSDSAEFARLHVIFFDNSLAHTTCFLKVGVLQIILSMIESGYATSDLILETPLAACHAWSHDPTLQATAKTIGGKRWTAVEMQRAMFDLAAGFCMRGGVDNVVPHWQAILREWGTVLDELAKRDWDALTGKLDWVLKKTIIERSLAKRDLAWDSPEAKHLDLLYSSVDPEGGLYNLMERAGRTKQLVTEEHIQHLGAHAPTDTRAWLRSEILKRFPDAVSAVGWDSIAVRDESNTKWTLPMKDPAMHNHAICGPVMSEIDSVEDLVRVFDFRETKIHTYTPQKYQYSNALPSHYQSARPSYEGIWPRGQQTMGWDDELGGAWEMDEPTVTPPRSVTVTWDCMECRSTWVGGPGTTYIICPQCRSKAITSDAEDVRANEPETEELTIEETFRCTACQNESTGDPDMDMGDCPECGMNGTLVTKEIADRNALDDAKDKIGWVLAQECGEVGCDWIGIVPMSENQCPKCKEEHALQVMEKWELQRDGWEGKCNKCGALCEPDEDAYFYACESCDEGTPILVSVDQSSDDQPEEATEAVAAEEGE